MWTEAAGELARKIASQKRIPVAMTLSVRNLSSLSDQDVTEVRQTLRAQLRGQGWRAVARQRATVEVRVTLSENSEGYLWVAETRRGESLEVRMISVPRAKGAPTVTGAEALVIRKTLLLSAEELLLDVALVDDGAEKGPSLLVLEPQRIALFNKQNGDWVVGQSVAIPLRRPLPRDLRGRLIIRSDGNFEAFLPGIRCEGRLQPSLTAECRESDDSWPLGSNSHAGARAHFARDRNFFDGRLALESGEATNMPSFYSAARWAEGREILWLLAGVDGHARLFGKSPKPLADFEGWGNDLVSVKSGCGSGRQILVTRAGDFTAADAVEGYEIVNRKAVSVGTPVAFSGPVVSLWPDPNGASAIAVVRNLDNQRYEAFTLSIACGQ